LGYGPPPTRCFVVVQDGSGILVNSRAPHRKLKLRRNVPTNVVGGFFFFSNLYLYNLNKEKVDQPNRTTNRKKILPSLYLSPPETRPWIGRNASPTMKFTIPNDKRVSLTLSGSDQKVNLQFKDRPMDDIADTALKGA
jgi:hypothetical protein